MADYLSYISNDHLFYCIEQLYQAYQRAKAGITSKKFYSNKIDTIKLTFDAKFNGMDEEELVIAEIARQIDKSINNAIGDFHENILGGIRNYERGSYSGYDIKATDDSLFAELKNKFNTMNSGSKEATFQKLYRFAQEYPNSNCYCVQILDKQSYCTQWIVSFKDRKYAHERIHLISGDQFYDLLSGENNSLYHLYKVLPSAIEDYLRMTGADENIKEPSAYSEIQKRANSNQRNILDQITFDNFVYYKGFNEL